MADTKSGTEVVKFGTDGWRAIIAEQFTFANVERVSYAIGLYIKETYASGSNADLPVLIGFDTRFLADAFAVRAAQVLMSMGLKVRVARRDIPTPCIAWATQAEPTGGALQFTASHNPPEYCGLKYIPPYAGPATNDITARIMENLKSCPSPVPISPEKPDSFDAMAPYLMALKKLVNMDVLSGSGLKVAYDALYSTSRGYLDKVLQECGGSISVQTLHAVRDPLFGGGMPEPREEFLGELIDLIKSNQFNIGIATDGDADRFAVVDDQGVFFTPNQLLCLLTRHLYKNHGMKGAIVRTVATTHMLDHVAAKYGLELIETPVGFKYIGEKMRTADVLIGGEESGGVSIKGHIPEKDGILANLLVIEMLAMEGKPLSKIWQEMEAEVGVRFYQRRGDLHFTAQTQKHLLDHLKKNPIKELVGKPLMKVGDKDGLKLYHDQDNWLLIRPSGTEPVIRVSGEGTSEPLIDSLMLDFRRQIDEILIASKEKLSAIGN